MRKAKKHFSGAVMEKLNPAFESLMSVSKESILYQFSRPKSICFMISWEEFILTIECQKNLISKIYCVIINFFIY